MNWRRIIGWIVGIVAAVTLVGGTFIASGGAVAAAPAARTAHAVPARTAAARITSKVTLPETSIDGPALASVETTSVIGWTGTDAAHHLNVELSRDGLHFDPSTKLTLNETSPYRPDVGLFSENVAISIAWTGSDTNHSLNVIFGVYQHGGEKLTLWHENSFTAPALLQVASDTNGVLMYLAWTGTDANHSLNFLPITDSGGTFTLGTKQTLSQFSSNAGPHLVPAGPDSVALCWTSRSGQPKVAVAGSDLKFGLVATLPEASAFAPAMLFRTSSDWIAWTGTDAAHHLNVEMTNSYPGFPNPKTILGDTAFGGPALGQNAGNQIVWTGTDAAHHLNVATFE